MANFKEIVTKAVIGKAKKTTTSKFNVKPEENPDTVLGCWIINHTFQGLNQGGMVYINGSFDVNVWYSYDNDTKTAVTTKRFDYSDKMNVKLRNGATLTNAEEIIVRSLTQPTVTDVKVENGVVNLNVEKELGVEIVGNTMIKVSVEDDEDEYDIIEDIDDEQTDIAIQNIDENYLK